MNKSVVDVVHHHDGPCGFRRLDRRWRHRHACGGFHCGSHNRIAGPDRSLATAHICSVSSVIIDARLSLTSFEIRNLVFQLVDRHVPSSNFQCLPADLAIAGAELVSLQGVQDT